MCGIIFQVLLPAYFIALRGFFCGKVNGKCAFSDDSWRCVTMRYADLHKNLHKKMPVSPNTGCVVMTRLFSM